MVGGGGYIPLTRVCVYQLYQLQFCSFFFFVCCLLQEGEGKGLWGKVCAIFEEHENFGI